MKLSITRNLHVLESLLFFLNVLFLPSQLGKHFWPDFSFIFSLRIDYLSPVIYLWDLLVIGLWIVLLIRLILRQVHFQLNQRFLFFVLFFLLTQTMSLLQASNIGGALVRLKEDLIVCLFALYIASSQSSKIKNIFFSALIWSALFTCLLAITQFLLGHSVGFWVLGERDFNLTTPLIARFSFYDHIFLRPYATFSHPNMLAAFLTLSLPLVLLGFPERFKKLELTAGLFISSSIFITFSRPALILILIQSSILFKKLWKLWLILGVVVTPLVFVRLISIFTFDSLAVLRRQELAEYAVITFLKHPLSGVGINNFINVLASDHILVGTSRFLQPAHNIFLLILAESGLLGLASFVTLLVSAFWINIRKKDPLSKVLLGNLLMIIFLGFFDHYFLTLPQGQRLFFLILGLSFMRRS